MTIIGIDHVQLAMPHGGEVHARRFWGEVMGLKEVAKPAHLAVNGGCWFAGGGVQIHCGVEEMFLPAKRAHPALLVDDLPALIGVHNCPYLAHLGGTGEAGAAEFADNPGAAGRPPLRNPTIVYRHRHTPCPLPCAVRRIRGSQSTELRRATKVSRPRCFRTCRGGWYTKLNPLPGAALA